MEPDVKLHMERALQLATKGWGKTHPNPMVGAVILDQGLVRGEGYHLQAGDPHAEINALKQLDGNLSTEATLFVTLEPCSTHGRTPPCIAAIIQSGIKRVVVGAIDPNPQHAGRGLDRLRKAGVAVTEGILSKECEDLNILYNYWIKCRSPLIAGKVATTIDGKLATRKGDSKWITGPQARMDVMRWRRLFPAIAVGANTVISDNPNLTSRMENGKKWCPVRIILDPQLRTVNRKLAKVYDDEDRERTVIVVSKNSDIEEKRKLLDPGIALWKVATNDEGIEWGAFRQKCVEEGLIGVLFEGGAKTISSLISSRELGYLFSYRAPKLLADPEALSAFAGHNPEMINDAITLRQVHHATLGDDELMRGYIEYPNKDNS
jgi:diaminohydroxyphosphoribosylaminopyrimidine deaminase/5-amino-6-(5-phosphoribosylamino)uracil reductase